MEAQSNNAHAVLIPLRPCKAPIRTPQSGNILFSHCVDLPRTLIRFCDKRDIIFVPEIVDLAFDDIKSRVIRTFTQNKNLSIIVAEEPILLELKEAFRSGNRLMPSIPYRSIRKSEELHGYISLYYGRDTTTGKEMYRLPLSTERQN